MDWWRKIICVVTLAERLEDKNQEQKQKIIKLEERNEKNAEILCNNCLNCSKKIYNKFDL